MRPLMFAVVAAATVALGSVVAAGTAAADHPLPPCSDVNNGDTPCQSQDDPLHYRGTDHNAPRQPHIDSRSVPSSN
ncbi:hypothetical protein [Nocardia terpenica]|uniref:Uncharacterized protein n=1 Tax=Nocardia terpenica TaxID=455432 RepID=A0A164NR55_9NOCA|nr:hypothetical protein [Nocardia terpenica]KZM74632.1 hypothetical protein AWN90_21395 [Nocardia terpenica]NQE93772.1 hypothetical protein [Nocardia terpenica]